jgi:hypothetical protein
LQLVRALGVFAVVAASFEHDHKAASPFRRRAEQPMGTVEPRVESKANPYIKLIT